MGYLYKSNEFDLSPEGWKCPVCGRVNAPWVPHCPCYRESESNHTITLKDSHTLSDFKTTNTSTTTTACSESCNLKCGACEGRR